VVESLCRTLLVDLGEARQGHHKQRENSSMHGSRCGILSAARCPR
jgi:hypothetical protein